jgi:hypothetical protein
MILTINPFKLVRTTVKWLITEPKLRHLGFRSRANRPLGAIELSITFIYKVNATVRLKSAECNTDFNGIWPIGVGGNLDGPTVRE